MITENWTTEISSSLAIKNLNEKKKWKKSTLLPLTKDISNLETLL